MGKGKGKGKGKGEGEGEGEGEEVAALRPLVCNAASEEYSKAVLPPLLQLADCPANLLVIRFQFLTAGKQASVYGKAGRGLMVRWIALQGVRCSSASDLAKVNTLLRYTICTSTPPSTAKVQSSRYNVHNTLHSKTTFVNIGTSRFIQLRAFNYEGYAFSAAASSEELYVYTRAFAPASKAKAMAAAATTKKRKAED
jgi:cytoplasmic iron level regulating protein YaaA (DUF328/UPF0246 family)